MKKENIVLIGFMGSGKTSVGMKLARALSFRFLDSDALIEEAQGETVSRIFETQGEEAFRRLETELLETLLKREERFVLATGGGMPVRVENVPLLKQLGTVLFLKTGSEEIIKRLQGDKTRPLLAEGGLKERVETLYAARLPFYEAAADYSLQTDGKSFYQMIKEAEALCFPGKRTKKGGVLSEAVNPKRTEP